MDKKDKFSINNSNRRNFLKVSAGTVAGGAVLSMPWASQLAQAASFSHRDAAAWPADSTVQPVETGWQLVDPPLTTPWTASVSPDRVLPEYPRPQMTRRRWANLNGVWQFAATQTLSPDADTALPERILVPFPVESGLSGILRQEPYLTYRRRFVVPSSWLIGGRGRVSGQRVLLHFDAVDYETTVWVNGQKVGEHRGGYDRFSFDITPHLTLDHAGRPEGEQELVVAVYDPSENGGQPLGKQRAANFGNPEGIFYTPASGIWQSVWMEPVPSTYIRRLQMTPDLEAGVLRLQVEIGGSDRAYVQAIAADGQTEVGRASGPVGQALEIPIPDAHLWSPDDPFLYDLTVRLLATGAHGTSHGAGLAFDQVGSYFGMRSIALKEVNGTPHMALNGEFLFEVGPLDQGYWPDGIYTAPTDEALKFDLIKTKELGYNMVRKHIKVESDRWYYHADTLGLLVWQDMPAMRLNPLPAPDDQAQFVRELKQMMDDHHNHPSIVVWVPFNEGWGRFDTANVTAQVKQWDPSRLANQMSGSNVCGCSGDHGDFLDLHNYVGPGPAPQPNDGRASVIGEFGGLGLLEPGHLWTTQNNHAYETEDTRAELTDRYVELLDKTRQLETRCGLSAIVYTQTTDVETEINGFFTYDRRILKLDESRMHDANQAVIRASGDVIQPNEPPPGTPGLVGVGFWALTQGSGTQVPDQSGQGHPATLVNGPAWLDTPDGAVLAFDGDNDFVDTGASLLDTTGNYSVSAYVWLDDKNGFHTAVSQDGDHQSEFFLQYSDADDRFAFSSVSVRALGRQSPELGRWYHLVGVRDAYHSTLKLYVDGTLEGMNAYCPGDAAPGHTVIGRARFNDGPVDFWHGRLRGVHVYDRALATAEVKQLYASGE